ncbi:MAG TPA: ABC transporter permease, partial [Flavobacterium sp.]
FFSFCLFLGILVKRSAFALGFLLVWSIFEGIIKGLLVFKIFPDSTKGYIITQFLPLEAMSNLILLPFPRLSMIKNIQNQIGYENNIDYSVNYFSVLIVLIWTFLFVYFSYKILKNRDL